MAYSLIQIGGLVFWVLVLVELIFLYQTVGLDKPRLMEAFASMVVFLAIVGLFGSLTWVGFKESWFALTKRDWAWSVGLTVQYVLLGICFSFFFMWPRWGVRRQRPLNDHMYDWLRERGVTDADVVPEQMRKEWFLHIYGNYDQVSVERMLTEAKQEFVKLFGKNREKPIYNLTPDMAPEFVNLAAYRDPQEIAGPDFRSAIVRLRHGWLLTQGANPTDQVPENLIDFWVERLTETFTSFNPEVAVIDGKRVHYSYLADVPIVRHNKARLATWAAWWPVSFFWYIGNEFIHEMWLGLIKVFGGILQRIMGRVYAKTRQNFQIPPPTKHASVPIEE